MRFGNTDRSRGPAGPRQRPQLGKGGKWVVGVILTLVVLIQVVPRLNHAYTEYLWYRSLGAGAVFRTEVLTRVGLFLLVGLLVAGGIVASALLAYRTRPILVRGRGQEVLMRYQNAVDAASKWVLLLGPTLLGILAGLFAQAQWKMVLAFFNSTPFGVTDPEFGKDISFYAFELGFWQFVVTWAMVVVVLAFFAGLLTHYVYGGLRLGSRDGVFSAPARIHLTVLAGVFVLIKAVGYWLDRYALLMHENETFTGAGYTDVNAVLPAKVFLFAVALLCAVAFFAAIAYKDLRIPALATVLLVFSAGIVGSAWPLLVEQFSVKPNRAEKEAEYISRNIAATRDAYGIGDDKVTYEPDWGAAAADPKQAEKTRATLNNIRVLDPNVLGPTFTQQQQLHNFFGFAPQLSMDRYTVDGKLQDYVVGARELNPNSLSENQKDWINRRTVYTHGSGLVMAPANRVDKLADDATSDSGGFPYYTNVDLNPDQRVKAPVSVPQPRIYYGPLTGSVSDDYAIVGATGGAREYDTDADRYSFSGEGGVRLGGVVNRLAFAMRYTERNILFSGLIGPDTKILFDRSPVERVKKVAPWLSTDAKTYPTVVDGRVVWIVDGYTTLDAYPYAQRTQLGAPERDQRTGVVINSNEVSYARNSVKAVVDAYDGSVQLYENDTADPVLQTWMKAFPGMVKPKDQMSKDLLDHIRYPEDLFNVQRQLIAKYHVSDPTQFFTNNAFWSIPADLSTRPASSPSASPSPATGPTGGIEATSDFTPQPPSYVVAADPTTGKPSFQLVSVFRGFQREIFAAHMSASSDPSDYGRITIRAQGPAKNPPPGPTQALNSMQKDPKVAEDRRLWSQTAKITEGNMLPLALDDGTIAYVVPIYAQRNSTDGAGDNTFPGLLRVMLFYNGQVGYARSLYEALSQVGIQTSKEETGTAEIETGTSDKPGGDAAAPAKPGDQKPGASPATPAPSTPAPTAGGRDAAVSQLDDALGKVDDAQKSGDLADLGRALEDLQKAVDAYNATAPK